MRSQTSPLSASELNLMFSCRHPREGSVLLVTSSSVLGGCFYVPPKPSPLYQQALFLSLSSPRGLPSKAVPSPASGTVPVQGLSVSQGQGFAFGLAESPEVAVGLSSSPRRSLWRVDLPFGILTASSLVTVFLLTWCQLPPSASF